MLEDYHILELSTRITNQQELMNLGINGLKLPRHTIQSALYNHKGCIQDAANDVLSTWAQRYETPSEAYVNILAGLAKCKMNHLASQLREWSVGVASTWPISNERKSNICSFQIDYMRAPLAITSFYDSITFQNPYCDYRNRITPRTLKMVSDWKVGGLSET